MEGTPASPLLQGQNATLLAWVCNIHPHSLRNINPRSLRNNNPHTLHLMASDTALQPSRGITLRFSPAFPGSSIHSMEMELRWP